MESSRSSSNDIISNLPTTVKETILTHLPIRDAVRTSVISRNWRYCWLYLPKLVFDDTLWQELTAREPFFTKNQLVFTIYQVLLLHQGLILEFTLSVSVLESCSEIDQLILFLSRKNVVRFVLHVWEGDHYKLPSSFFSYPKLIHLNLRSCVFNPPSSFNGFSQLISMKFFGVTISAETHKRFISSCLLLERLNLTTSATFEYISINAVRLKYLFIRGHLKSIFLKNAPLLTEVSIGLYSSLTKEQMEQGGTSNFNEIFVCLPVLKKLALDFYIIQLLAAGSVLKKLPTTSINLKFLKLTSICFGRLDELSFGLCLIKGLPKLQNIEIELFSAATVPSSILEFLEEQDYLDVSLENLQLVMIQHLSGMQSELEFIKLILAKSPMLEKLLIEYNPEKIPDKGQRMLKDLIRFECVSPKAQIIFEDPLPS